MIEYFSESSTPPLSDTYNFLLSQPLVRVIRDRICSHLEEELCDMLLVGCQGELSMLYVHHALLATSGCHVDASWTGCAAGARVMVPVHGKNTIQLDAVRTARG